MLPDLLKLGTRCTLVGGKGGVGKTTTAAALALSLAEAGREVLVLSVDPAHSLGDALGGSLGPDPTPVPGVPGLRALELDAERERERFLKSRRGAFLQLLERGTYLDQQDASGLLDLAVPGVDELAALFRLLELTAGDSPYLVIDTAPTGHTLRLLDLPRQASGWLRALQAMEEKHQAVAQALVGAYREDEVTRLLGRLDADLAGLQRLLSDPERTRFLLVTTREPVVLAETRRYRDELARLGIAVAGVLANRAADGVSPSALGEGMAFVPPLPADPRGVEGLRRFAESARATPAPAPGGADAAPERIRVGERFAPALDRRLYLVGGKGGVGKSTASAALALLLTEAGRGPVLLLGTDPAGSLGDVLGQAVGAEPRPVRDAPRLLVQQVDAGAAWADFRDRYREEAERLFGGLLSGGLSATADQRVVERLIDLAPPGVDELMALLEVVDVTEDRPYDALVLDTAPTGHLLRLLELPELALEWTHMLLRLLLKYREVVGLGDLAERVLALSRTLRGLGDQLRDPRHTWTLAVALPEALSVPETGRLLARLRELRIEPGALLVNRVLESDGRLRPAAAARAGELLEAARTLPCAGAPEWDPAPVGPSRLAEFGRAWREITLA